MKEAERNAERESIVKIEGYKKEEKHTIRKIKGEREAMQDNGRQVDYIKYKSVLLEKIETLKGDLLDIEMALQHSLEGARGGFFSQVKSMNDEMNTQQGEVFNQITGEVQAQFSLRLKEELSKEKENFIARLETDEQGVLEDYGLSSLEDVQLGSVVELFTSADEGSDVIGELVTQFVEKIESELGVKQNLMTKGRTAEWNEIMNTLMEGQHSRGRQIISEIIETTNRFRQEILNKFQNYEEEDEEENR